MPRKRKPVPPVQVMARMVGTFQWICPHCSYIHGTKYVRWRDAAVTCSGCARRFRTGLGFTSQLGAVMPPFNAIYAGPFDNYNANALEVMPAGTPAIGRVGSFVEWHCPNCHTPQSCKVEWDTSSVSCLKCAKVWYLRVIYWKATKLHLVTPYDWTPIVRQFQNRKSVRFHDQEIPVQRVDAEEVGTK